MRVRSSNAPRTERQRFQRTGTVFGPAEPRLLARWIGWLMFIAGVVAGVSMIFPQAPYADFKVSVSAVGIALSLGILLVIGLIDDAPLWVFRPILAFSTALGCAGVYGGGSPVSGGQFFLLWVIPLAFAFFTVRQAVVQLIWSALGYGVVLAIQLHQYPGLGSTGEIVGMWFITVMTELVIGLIVRRISRSLRDVDRRLQRAFQDSPVGCAFLSTEFVFLQVNRSLCQMLNCEDRDLLGRTLFSVVREDDASATTDLRNSVHLRGVQAELRLIDAIGQTVSCAVSAALIRPETGEPYVFSQFLDVTERVHDREVLAQRAIHDPLTGLYNRSLLIERLADALAGVRTGDGIAVLMLDLDQFKVLNDSLGHEVGDQLLIALAPRLESVVSRTDTLARFGGDEFVVLCEHVVGIEDALERAHRIAECLEPPVSLIGAEYVVSASIGVALSDRSSDAAALLRDADAAMYRAKASGRNRVAIFDHTMRDEVLDRLELEANLRQAVTRHELDLEFQPIIDITNGRVVMLEALLRWNHPRRGRLLPAEFIALAEETGLITHIGDFVLETALSRLSYWQAELDAPDLKLSVNISARQLTEPDFVSGLASRIEAARISPGSLGLEITESVLLGKDLPASVLDGIKSLGVDLMLDDFGTGYSSLAYLEQYPIDVLKVDQAFVARLEEGVNRRVVLQAILTMAAALSIQVIVEGAENEERIATLRSIGCRLAQGNALARPLRAADVVTLLTSQHLLDHALETGS